MPALGWLKDPAKGATEKPDMLASAVLGAERLPSECSQRELIVSILDQGSLGSCVANAGMQAIRGSHVRQLVARAVADTKSQAIVAAQSKAHLGSRLFGYYLARATHHATGQDSGTHLRSFFDVVVKFGFPPEESWPYSDHHGLGAKVYAMPSTKAFHDAFDQRSPTSYHRITEYGAARVTAVKRALAAGYLVCFGTQVDSHFANGNIGDVIQPPIGKPLVGGHAMTIVGYDKRDVFLIANSWGTKWGTGGFCHFAPEYIGWASSDDFWIVQSSPVYS